VSLYEEIAPLGSVLIALATVVLTTLLLSRQIRQMEHERNALALLQAIDRLTSPPIVHAFVTLRDVEKRYPTDDALRTRFDGSEDEEALGMVGQYVETVACLARRNVLDASLIVDAVGYMLRARWATIREFVHHLRVYNNNAFLFENFEWLARYSAWWKDTPRSPRDLNYLEGQFAPSLDEEFSKLKPVAGRPDQASFSESSPVGGKSG
jgi:hypothetical protein